MRISRRAAALAAAAITGLTPAAVTTPASAAIATNTVSPATPAITVKATVPVAAAGVVATNPRTDTVYVAGEENVSTLPVISGRTNVGRAPFQGNGGHTCGEPDENSVTRANVGQLG